MAHNEIDVDAPPASVYAVLADPRSFARWVVGSREIRRADPGWPAPGTAFDHRVGIGPLTVADHSEVLDSEPGRRLRMLVKARPFTRAHVLLRLEPRGAGRTRVTMDEGPADLRSRLFMNPLTDPLVRLRNKESLRRLKALAEGAEPIPDGHLPPRGSAREASVQGSSRPAAT
jgi:uncharacterized protein YndB with AHSA1/START domain